MVVVCRGAGEKSRLKKVLEERSAISGRGSIVRILNLVPWRANCGGM